MSGLIVDTVSLGFGGPPLLSAVSLHLAPGETVGLSGPSGSGKSQLGLAMLGLLPSTATITGDIRLGATHLNTLDEAARRQWRGRQVGMVFQEPMTALNPLMSIGGQIAEAAERARDADPGKRLRADDPRVLGLMREVNLDPDHISPRAYPFQLSGGQRQRVAIAMVLAQSPSVIIADEPTTALDMVSQKKVLDVLVKTVRDRDVSMLLISHDQALIKAYTDRHLKIKDQTIVADQADGAAPHHAVMAPQPTDKAQTPLLQVRGLSLSYPARTKFFWQKPARKRVVKAASFTVYAGEVVGIAGASGCGKSTLLKGLVNLLRADEGTVTLTPATSGAPPGQYPGPHPIQIVFQDPKGSLNPHHTLLQSLTEPLHNRYDLDAEEKKSLAQASLTQVGLSPDMVSRLPDALSGGQRQRVAIARAMIANPAVVLFDEAVSALDPGHQYRILTLIQDLMAKRAMAGIFVSHDLRFLRRLCSRILMISEGSIVEEIASGQPLSTAQHPASRALIDATPGLEEDSHANRDADRDV
ncbi:MAG: ABC transporter ATP-binding protein [Pseudomonadota bacterium]